MTFTRREYKGICTNCGSETIHWEEIPGEDDDPMDYSFSSKCERCESRGDRKATPRGLVPLTVGSLPAVRIFEPLYIFLELTSILGGQREDGSFTEHTLGRFARTLQEVPGARVVFTSQWMQDDRFDEAVSCFSDGLVERFIGYDVSAVTTEEPTTKHDDIRAYLHKHGLVEARWIAIDHEAHHYLSEAPFLQLDWAKGFDPEAVVRFFQFLGFPSGIGSLVTYAHQMERFPLDSDD